MNNTHAEATAIQPVIKTLEVSLPPEQAFRLFTARVDRWWPLTTHSVFGDEAVSCHVEGWVGGRFYERHGDGREAEWGIVQVWDPPDRVAFSFFPGLTPEEATSLDVVFAPSNRGTQVTLTHSGWEGRGELGALYRDKYNSGWDVVLTGYTDSVLPQAM
jgi:hypothetical protein